MLLHAGNAEIIAQAADREHQRVVAEAAPGNDLFSIVVQGRRKQHLLALAIQADHAAQTVAKMIPARLCEVFQLILGRIQRSRRNLVQQRLPDMCAAGVDQRDFCKMFPAKPVAQPGRQFQTGRSAADDNDVRRLSHVASAFSALYISSRRIIRLCRQADENRGIGIMPRPKLNR